MEKKEGEGPSHDVYLYTSCPVIFSLFFAEHDILGTFSKNFLFITNGKKEKKNN